MHSITSSPLVTVQTPDSGFTNTPNSTKSPAYARGITFTEAIRQAREAAGKTRDQVAHDVGISVNALGRIENRKNAYSLATAAALCIYFNLPAESMLRP